MAEQIDRRRAKAEERTLLRDAQVPPRRFYALYLAIMLALNLASAFATGESTLTTLLSRPLGLFVLVLVNLLSLLLGSGCYLYLFGIRRGERVEYLALFDGFSFAGRIILLYLAVGALIGLWFLPASAAFSVAYAGVLSGGSGVGMAGVLLPLGLAMLLPGFAAVYRYRFAILNLCENPGGGVGEAIRMSRVQSTGYKAQLFALDLSYLLWALLASAPDVVMDLCYYLQTAGVKNGLVSAVTSLSAPVQALISGLALLAVGVFFLPEYQAVSLRYFDTAKHTSGIGAGLAPREPENGGE